MFYGLISRFTKCKMRWRNARYSIIIKIQFYKSIGSNIVSRVQFKTEIEA
jgi:hypothetical protein